MVLGLFGCAQDDLWWAIVAPKLATCRFQLASLVWLYACAGAWEGTKILSLVAVIVWLVGWLAGCWLADRLAGWLAGWRAADWLAGWLLAGWLAGWLANKIRATTIRFVPGKVVRLPNDYGII